MTKRMWSLRAGILVLGLTAAPLADVALGQEADRPQTQQSDEGFDDWGLLGLAGLAGLAGLMRRDRERRVHTTGAGHTTRT